MRLKKLLAMLLTVVLLVSSTVIALPVSADGNAAWVYDDSGLKTGTGAQNDPYIIATAQDLATLAYKVNTVTDFSKDKHFRQEADIDLANQPWCVIGRVKNTYAFAGSYDGQGYAIKNLNIETINGLTAYGLFGYTAWRSGEVPTEIKNVNIVNGDISVSGAQYVGALVGYVYNGATITNCSNMASVTVTNMTSTDSAFGGLVGALNSNGSLDIEVANCYNGADVTVTSTSASKININIGGMFGDVQASAGASFTNCVNYGKVTLTNSFANNVRAGGVIGYLNAMNGGWSWNANGAAVTMTNVNNITDISVAAMEWSSPVGSLIGYARLSSDTGTMGTLTLSDCYAGGELKGIKTASATAEIQRAGVIGHLKKTNLVSGEKENCYTTKQNRYDVDGATVMSWGHTNGSYVVGFGETDAAVNGTAIASNTINPGSPITRFTQGTKNIDISALSMLPTGTTNVQYKTDANVGYCIRFSSELNLDNLKGIKDIGFLVDIGGDSTTNGYKLSGNKTVYSSLNALNGEQITPEGVGYIIAAGISDVPETGTITFKVTPYVEFEDGTVAYGTQSNLVTVTDGGAPGVS